MRTKRDTSRALKGIVPPSILQLVATDASANDFFLFSVTHFATRYHSKFSYLEKVVLVTTFGNPVEHTGNIDDGDPQEQPSVAADFSHGCQNRVVQYDFADLENVTIFITSLVQRA